MKNTTVMDHLRSRGFRTTKARTAILDFFHTIKTPVDVESIKNNLKQQGIKMDLANIYRSINTFLKEGIIRRVAFEEGKYRYELSSLPHHHHVICTNCGSIEDVAACDMNLIEDKITSSLKFSIQNHKLEFFGLCINCQ